MKTTLFFTVSLDGFIARADDSTPWGPELWDAYAQRCNEAKHIIIGRRSYELLQQDASAADLELSKIFVVSKEGVAASNEKTIVVSSPKDAIESVKKAGFDSALVVGGAKLANSFLEQSLINEIVLDIAPFILGSGIPMIGPITSLRELALVREQKTSAGNLRLTYRVKNPSDSLQAS